VETIEKRQGLEVSCVEEIAYRMGYIDAQQLSQLAQSLNGNGNGRYLLDILEQRLPTARQHEPGAQKGVLSSTACQH